MAWSKERTVTPTKDQWETVTSLMRMGLGEMTDVNGTLADLHDELERQVAEQDNPRFLRVVS